MGTSIIKNPNFIHTNSTQNLQTTKTAPTSQEHTVDRGSYLIHKKNPDTNEWEEEIKFKRQPNVTYDDMEFGPSSSGRNDDQFENGGNMEYDSSPEFDNQCERVSMYPHLSFASRPMIKLDPHEPMSLKVLKNLLSEIEQNSSKTHQENGVNRSTQNNPRNGTPKQNSKTKLQVRECN